MARAQFDFGGCSARSAARPSRRVASKVRGIADAGGVVGRDRRGELPGIDPDQLRQLGERIGAQRRHLGTDRALPVGDFEQAAVEDRVGDRSRRLEVEFARKPFPGLVHQAAALVEEAAAVAVDHDAIGIDQDHRCGIARARIDRLGMHAVPVAGAAAPIAKRHADAVAGVEARARRDQPHRLGARAEMLAHHRGVALEAAAGENDRVRRDVRRAACVTCEAADAAGLRDDRARRAAMADRDAGRAGGARQRRDDRRPAAGRLDARRALSPGSRSAG